MILPNKSISGSVCLIAKCVGQYFDIGLLQDIGRRARLSPPPASCDAILTRIILLSVCWEADWGNAATKGDRGAQSQHGNVVMTDMVADHVLWKGGDFRYGHPVRLRGGSVVLPKGYFENGQRSELSIFDNTVGCSEDMLTRDEGASAQSSILDVH